MFEVEHLKYATLATVSRCGMIWFSEDVVEPSMVFRHYLETLSTVPLDAEDDEAAELPGRRTEPAAGDSPRRRSISQGREAGPGPGPAAAAMAVAAVCSWLRERRAAAAAMRHGAGGGRGQRCL